MFPTLQRSAIPKQGIITSCWLRPVFSSPLHPRDPPPLTRPSRAHSAKTEHPPPHFSTSWAKPTGFPHHTTSSTCRKSTLTSPTPASSPAIDKSQNYFQPPFDNPKKHYPPKTTPDNHPRSSPTPIQLHLTPPKSSGQSARAHPKPLEPLLFRLIQRTQQRILRVLAFLLFRRLCQLNINIIPRQL